MSGIDWEPITLRDVAAFASGKTPSRSRQADFFDNGTIPWVKTMDLTNAGIFTTDEHVTKQAIRDVKLPIQPLGTVLVAMYGGFSQIGRTGVLRTPAATNQAITAVLPDNRWISSDYLLHLLNYNVGYWRTVASSSRKDPNITKADVKAFPLNLPPLPEQNSIAGAINDTDNLISAIGALIAKMQEVKQGSMQQLLTGRTRLPGFSEPWQDRQLGDLLLRPPRYGINAAAEQYAVGIFAYIRITDIDEWGGFAPRPRVGVQHPNAINYLLQPGELVFARTGASVGKSYLYDPCVGELVYAGFLISIAPDPAVLDPRYLAQFARSFQYWDWVARTSARSGQPGINGREYAQMPITLPDIQEQQAIVNILQEVDSEIDVLRERLDKARDLKIGMMQQLLTGRTRLPVQEAAS